MKVNFKTLLIGLFGFFWILTATIAVALAADPLPSWNDGKSKQSILTFLEKVTTPGAPDFVPPAERIATFDNDGTLWSEQPMYFQLFFALDRVKALAPQHPEWKNQEPFASLLQGNVKQALAGGEKAILEIVMATHAGMTTKQGLSVDLKLNRAIYNLAMHYVYLIRSIPNPDQTYVGHTKDLKTRLLTHNHGQSPHTSKYKPWELITYLAFNNKSKALSFEKYLKSHSGHAFATKRLW